MRRFTRTTILLAAALVVPAEAGAHLLPGGLDQAFAAGASTALRIAEDVPRWGDVVRREAEQQPYFASFTCGFLGLADAPVCRYAAWRRSLAALDAEAPLTQIAAVHRAVNRLPYIPDGRNWNMADRWSTPLEMFERGGDCEDFALTKYFALRMLGFADADMRLVVVWDAQDREQHAVLLVRSAGAMLVLDNKFAEPRPAADLAGRYRPLYAVNQAGAWLAQAPAAAGPAGGGKRPRLADGGRTMVFKLGRQRKRARRAVPLPDAAHAAAWASHVRDVAAIGAGSAPPAETALSRRAG